MKSKRIRLAAHELVNYVSKRVLSKASRLWEMPFPKCGGPTILSPILRHISCFFKDVIIQVLTQLIGPILIGNSRIFLRVIPLIGNDKSI